MTDWVAIQAEYGAMSLRKLAAKHGISKSGIAKRASAEGWTVDKKVGVDTAKVDSSGGHSVAILEMGYDSETNTTYLPHRPLDGTFDCAWGCGHRSDDLSDHVCDVKKKYAVGKWSPPLIVRY